MDKEPRRVDMPVWMKQMFLLSIFFLTACSESVPTAGANTIYTVAASRMSPNTCAMTVSGGEALEPVKLIYPKEQVKSDPGLEESEYIGLANQEVSTGERTSDKFVDGYLYTGGEMWCPAPVAIELSDTGQVLYCQGGTSADSETTVCK